MPRFGSQPKVDPGAEQPASEKPPPASILADPLWRGMDREEHQAAWSDDPRHGAYQAVGRRPLQQVG